MSSVKRDYGFYDENNPDLRASVSQEPDGAWVVVFEAPDYEGYDAGDMARVLLAADDMAKGLNEGAAKAEPATPKVRRFRPRSASEGVDEWRLEQDGIWYYFRGKKYAPSAYALRQLESDGFIEVSE